MYCPQCKSEFVEGITQCSDCQVALVWSLRDEKEQDGERVEWAPLVLTVNQSDLAVIKSILESENILYFVQGENFGIMQQGSRSGAVVLVDKNQLQDAQACLRDLELNNFAFSTRASDDLE
jgi:hypothetical protein